MIAITTMAIRIAAPSSKYLSLAVLSFTCPGLDVARVFVVSLLPMVPLLPPVSYKVRPVLSDGLGLYGVGFCPAVSVRERFAVSGWHIDANAMFWLIVNIISKARHNLPRRLVLLDDIFIVELITQIYFLGSRPDGSTFPRLVVSPFKESFILCFLTWSNVAVSVTGGPPPRLTLLVSLDPPIVLFLSFGLQPVST